MSSWFKKHGSALNEKKIIRIGKKAIERQATVGTDEYSVFLLMMLQNRREEMYQTWSDYYLSEMRPVLATTDRSEQIRLLREITLTLSNRMSLCDALINEFGDCEFSGDEIDTLLKGLDNEGRSSKELRFTNIQAFLEIFMSLAAIRGLDAGILPCLDLQAVDGYTSKCNDVYSFCFSTMLRGENDENIVGLGGLLSNSLLQGLEKIKTQIVAGTPYMEIHWGLTPSDESAD